MPVCFAEVEGEYAKDKDLKKEDVTTFKKWVKDQPHLPNINELKLISFLHAAYFNIEKAKELLESFYTAKAHAPELFLNRDVKNDLIQQTMQIGCLAVLPFTTDEGYKVTYGRIVNPNTELFDMIASIKVFDMSTRLSQMQEGIAPGQILLLDSKGLRLGHAVKCDLSTCMKLSYYVQDCYPHRLKGVHLINTSPLNIKLYKLLKPMLKKEMVEIIHLHPKIDTLYDFIPKRIMPKEYGGESPTLKEIHETFVQNMTDNYEFFESENLEFTDESKRIGRKKTSADVFGIEGSFRNLQID